MTNITPDDNALMDNLQRIDFITGSIDVLRGPVILYRLKKEPACSDLRQYLKACEVFTENFGTRQKVFAVVIDAKALEITEANLFDEFAMFYASQQKVGIGDTALVIPDHLPTRLTLESRLSENWGVPDKNLWFSSADEALMAVQRIVATSRRTIL